MLGAEQRQSMERAGWRRGGAEDGLKLEEGRVTWRVLLVRGEGNKEGTTKFPQKYLRFILCQSLS